MKAPTLQLLLLALVATSASAEDKKPKPYADVLRESLPVIHVGFDQRDMVPSKPSGQVKVGVPGPTSKAHKGFSDKNQAGDFKGSGSRLIIKDAGDRSQFDFDQGDPITIEAWVNLDAIGKNENVYIIGKGRTGNKGFDGNNQNWGLRLWEKGGVGRPSFLFRSRGEKAGSADDNWHRWTANTGVAPKTGWHHVAVTYQFGDPKSLRAWIDGNKIGGAWDMGGATKLPPIVDNDEIWIGASMRGNASSSFRGKMDEVTVYRRVLNEDMVASRYPVEPYSPPIRDVASGKVLVEIVENIGVTRSWPRRIPEPQDLDVYETEVFGFPMTIQKYDETGVIADRSNPHLLRASADVVLPKGKSRLLLRTRSAGRVWLNGKVIAETPFAYTGGGGHNDTIEVTPQHSPKLRYLGAGDREELVELEGDGKKHRLIFELMVGDGRVRPTLGESSISISSETDEEFFLLTPNMDSDPIMLADKDWLDFRNQTELKIRTLDAERRLIAAKNEDAYWKNRHKNIKIAATGDASQIDHLLAKGWSSHGDVKATTTEGLDYDRDVKPILAENCYRCHEEKVKGGLRVDQREALLAGGDSELAAIVPGDPHTSYLLEVIDPDSEDRMPPKGDPLTEKERSILTEWVASGAKWSTGASAPVELTERTSDDAFIRRVTLDLVGRVPTSTELATFKKDGNRAAAIDRLIADNEGWADRWTSYWQDVLAENPNILKPSLNNTGPFRWWIWEALYDNKSMDRFVTELVLMRGSERGGGPAGFGLAYQNDVPMAAKAHVVGTAFLGVEMKCARCHDAPYHKSTQEDLFQLAAMLNRKPLKLPESSTVPAGSIPTDRKPLITISLKPGAEIAPEWPFEFGGTEIADGIIRDENNYREKLAAMVTSPENDRFAKVIANRMWHQLMGAGFVEPVYDWEAMKPLHPEVLDFLAHEFVGSGYDLKALARLITNSEAYQRESRPAKPGVTPDFAAPVQRRMSAEQVVDSLFTAAGKPLDSEELTFDTDGTQTISAMTSLGNPRRAWQFTSLSNERDRPSLAIPKAQVVLDVLENFGWRAARAEPKSERETAPNVLQPAIIANGALNRWVTTLSEDHAITDLALQKDLTLDRFVTEVFERYLTRPPSAEESILYAELLSAGFADRVIPEDNRPDPIVRKPLKYVGWSNHLSKEANSIKIEMEQRAREGEPPTVALNKEWRERVEDMLWAVTNSPEFIYLP